MSSAYSIQVENLGKRYRLGVIGRQTMAEELQYWFCKATGRDPAAHMGIIDHLDQTIPQSRLDSQRDLENPGFFWSLKDINFTMRPGEIVGVIGPNGAGKSTLLKILARLTEPTQGKARIAGRMSSLLEVGTGFHPELTGRENIFVNGAILGMQESEIKKKFDAIVAFSEVGDFIKTPVKRYSSGMRTRLAFSVAAHLEPDVLLLDEVLAVGDASFQKKCAVKMKELAGQGRTVLIVSHSVATVSEMCSRCLWIDKGRLVMDGLTENVIRAYSKMNSQNPESVALKKSSLPSCLENLSLCKIQVRDSRDHLVEEWQENEEVLVEIFYEIQDEISGLQLGLAFLNQESVLISESMLAMDPASCSKGKYTLRALIPGGSISPGRLSFSFVAGTRDETKNIQIGKAHRCQIVAGSKTIKQRGRLRLPLDWKLSKTPVEI